MSSTSSDISIQVQLDVNHVAESIHWTAPDGGIYKEPTKAIMLSVWDHKEQETLKIDLWTKDMPVDQMRMFFHQALLSMADSYQKATEDKDMSDALRSYCDYFAEERKLIILGDE